MMTCMHCGGVNTKVVYGVLDEDGYYKRRRRCKDCHKAYYTVEIPATYEDRRGGARVKGQRSGC